MLDTFLPHPELLEDDEIMSLLVAATTVPETVIEPTPETFLAMELVENYLAMGKPQHESIQTRFSLTTAKKQRPVAWYEVVTV